MVQSTEQTPPAAETPKETKPDTQVLVYRIPLDPKPSQVTVLKRYARAYRSTYNYGQRLATISHEQWAAGRDKLLDEGMSKAEANKKAPKVKHPTAYSMAAVFRANREREFQEGTISYRWWDLVNENMCCNAFADVQSAWNGWRSGRTGYPKFKRHGGGRQSFRVQKGKFDDIRHLRIPGGGGQKALSVRTRRPASRIMQDLNRDGKIGAITVSCVADRWFASVNIRVPARPKPKPTRAQRANGAVGVDLGISVIAATSKDMATRHKTPQNPVPQVTRTQIYENPHHLAKTSRNLAKWQRRAAKRYRRGKSFHEQSHGWHEAVAHVRRLHALVAERRATTQHQLTKTLATQFETVFVEDIQVQKMTRSPRGTTSKPGRGVKHKAQLNKAVLDVGFGEIRRQLQYKSDRYGSVVEVVDPAYTSQTCAKCGHVDKRSRKSAKEFVCMRCSHAVHAKIGAAKEIERRGTTPPKQ